MNGLKIEADFNLNDINSYIDDVVNGYIKYVEQVYIKAGQAMVEDARSRVKGTGSGSFGNITWNLRSSIGCVVYNGSQKVYSYFPVLSTGQEGSKVGEAYADEIAMMLTENNELTLVVVAGMEYAAAVESKGYNVITATSNIAHKILGQFIQQEA